MSAAVLPSLNPSKMSDARHHVLPSFLHQHAPVEKPESMLGSSSLLSPQLLLAINEKHFARFQEWCLTNREIPWTAFTDPQVTHLPVAVHLYMFWLTHHAHTTTPPMSHTSTQASKPTLRAHKSKAVSRPKAIVPLKPSSRFTTGDALQPRDINRESSVDAIVVPKLKLPSGSASHTVDENTPRHLSCEKPEGNRNKRKRFLNDESRKLTVLTPKADSDRSIIRIRSSAKSDVVEATHSPVVSEIPEPVPLEETPSLAPSTLIKPICTSQQREMKQLGIGERETRRLNWRSLIALSRSEIRDDLHLLRAPIEGDGAIEKEDGHDLKRQKRSSSSEMSQSTTHSRSASHNRKSPA